jgi:hypothetical protein
MDGYPLKTLLALRRREEAAAEANWRAAQVAVKVAEAALDARNEAVAAARARLREARAAEAGGVTGASSSAATLSQSRFVARRRDELARAEADRSRFRAGPLGSARADERRARAAYAERCRARQAVEQHEGRYAAAVRREVDTREAAASDDVAQFNRHRRERDG